MSIKTTLRTIGTDASGNLCLGGSKAFHGAFKLGLILESQCPISREIPTNRAGLKDIEGRLDNLIFSCLSGISGIGALIGAANPASLIQSDLENIGVAITNMAALAMESADYLESIEIDARRRDEKAELAILTAGEGESSVAAL